MEAYIVSLPISPIEADMAGMPAEWLARAIRAIGQPTLTPDALSGQQALIEALTTVRDVLRKDHGNVDGRGYQPTCEICVALAAADAALHSASKQGAKP